MLTVDARAPLSKSWFDHAAAAPAVSMAAATTPPWYTMPSFVRSARNGSRSRTSSGS